MTRLSAIVVGVLVLGLVVCGTASADELGTPRVTSTFGVGAGPMPDVAPDPSTHRTVVKTIAVGAHPVAATVDSDAHTVYVTNHGGDSVSVIDSETRAVTDTVPVGHGPQTVAADPSTHTAWVVNFTDNSISVIERAPVSQ